MSHPRYWALCDGNPPVIDGFSSQLSFSCYIYAIACYFFFPIPLFLAVSFFLLPFFQFSVTFFPVTFFPVSFCPVTFIPVSFFPIFIVTFFPVTFFPVTFFPVSFFTFLFFLLLCFLLRELESNWSGCNVLNFSWNFCFIPQILVVARMSIYEHVTWFTALVLLKLGL